MQQKMGRISTNTNTYYLSDCDAILNFSYYSVIIIIGFKIFSMTNKKFMAIRIRDTILMNTQFHT